MKIRIDYIAQAKKITGVGSEYLSINEGTGIKELLFSVAQKHGPELTSLVLSKDGSVQRSIIISINDEQVFVVDDQKLIDGDVIAVMPPMSGG
jgi:molybdopterin converting factor small subunit